jgi:hypothetical protein
MEEHDCSKHDNRKRFDFILKKFLSEKVESDQGSWAPVTPETKGQLDELIHLLILLKWEEDCDGDLPVRYKVWDRTKDMQDSYSQFVVPKAVCGSERAAEYAGVPSMDSPDCSECQDGGGDAEP